MFTRTIVGAARRQKAARETMVRLAIVLVAMGLSPMAARAQGLVATTPPPSAGMQLTYQDDYNPGVLVISGLTGSMQVTLRQPWRPDYRGNGLGQYMGQSQSTGSYLFWVVLDVTDPASGVAFHYSGALVLDQGHRLYSGGGVYTYNGFFGSGVGFWSVHS